MVIAEVRTALDEMIGKPGLDAEVEAGTKTLEKMTSVRAGLAPKVEN